MSTAPVGESLFFIYKNGEFHKAEVTQYFGGKVSSVDDIVSVIENAGYETMTRTEVDAGEIRFALWEGPDHQCVVRITTEGLPHHYIYLDGLLNWLQFQGAILTPAFQMAGLVRGDA